MRASLTAKPGSAPRLPLLGTALAAMGGIAAAELGRTCLPAASGVPAAAHGFALAGFGLLLGLWTWRRCTGWFLLAAAAGFAALHLFAADPVAARSLARCLAAPEGSIARGHDPTHGTAHVLHAVGTVLDLPRLVPPPDELPAAPAGPTWRFTFELERAEVDGRRWPCRAVVNATWRDAPAVLSPGDRLEVTALAENLRPPRNPGEPDHAARLRRQGILSVVRIAGVADGRVLPPAEGGAGGFSLAPARRLAGRVHAWVERALSLDLGDDPEASAVVSTTLLGLAGPPGLGDLENVFQRTGTLHYFAIDGLKLSLVSLLLVRALALGGVRRPARGLLVLPLLLGYAFATGLGAASARAVVVAAVLLGGELVDRPTRPLNSLGAAAALLLLLHPPSLFDLGFQLTFSVMLAILLLVPPLARFLTGFGAPDPFLPRSLFSHALRAREWLRHHACELTAVSVAAWIGSLPLMFVTFHLFSPVSLVANVVTFPLAFAVLALGVLSVAAAGASTVLATWFNNTNWLLAKTFLWLVRWFDALPGGSLAVPAFARWHLPAPAAELVVYDFDRGRAAALRAGRAEWLLDTARPAEYGGGVLPSLRAGAVEHLTGGLLLTRNDADHLAAAPLALTDLHPTRVVDSALSNRSPLLREFRRRLAGRGQAETLLHHGDLLPLGKDTHATVLYPPDKLSGKFRSAADRALTLRIDAARWRVLLLTEGNGAAARWLPGHTAPADLAADVLVTAAPVDPALLAAVRPKLLVLRAPIVRETASGLPPPTLEPAPLPTDLPTLVQRESGAVTLLLYPGRLEATGFLDGRKVVLRP